MVPAIRREMLFGGAATGIFVFGFVMAVLGTLFGLPEMRARLQINLAQKGNLFFLLYVGIFLATLVAGPAIDVIGNKLVLIASAALVAVGMAGFAFAHSYAGAVIPVVLLGAGGAGLNTSANALVSDLYGNRRGPMLNILGTFYGVGALCIPLFAALIAGHLSIVPQLLVCAALAAGCAVLFPFLQTNRSAAMLIFGVLIIGLSYAGIFPTVLAIAGDAYTKLAGTVFGLLFAIALTGGMSFPWVLGQISQNFGLRLGMIVPLLGAAVICILAWRVIATGRPARTPRS